jgi:hypothetical protein
MNMDFEEQDCKKDPVVDGSFWEWGEGEWRG